MHTCLRRLSVDGFLWDDFRRWGGGCLDEVSFGGRDIFRRRGMVGYLDEMGLSNGEREFRPRGVVVWMTWGMAI